ncbi:hypothetical protein ACLOJK_019350, partial [Asimina triloba]
CTIGYQWSTYSAPPSSKDGRQPWLHPCPLVASTTIHLLTMMTPMDEDDDDDSLLAVGTHRPRVPHRAIQAIHRIRNDKLSSHPRDRDINLSFVAYENATGPFDHRLFRIWTGPSFNPDFYGPSQGLGSDRRSRARPSIISAITTSVCPPLPIAATHVVCAGNVACSVCRACLPPATADVVARSRLCLATASAPPCPPSPAANYSAFSMSTMTAIACLAHSEPWRRPTPSALKTPHSNSAPTACYNAWTLPIKGCRWREMKGSDFDFSLFSFSF